MSTTGTQSDAIVVRCLATSDLPAVVAIDALVTGRRREEFLALKLTHALSDTGIVMSLGAACDGRLIGFMLARVYYGEFGVMEPAAVMDVLGIHPDFQRRGVGAALIDQLRTNLLGLGIRTLRTEVGWTDLDLLAFFQHEGFTPAPRLCLELDLGKPARTER
jgi:GNAT superfamily N-acetyltransferase